MDYAENDCKRTVPLQSYLFSHIVVRTPSNHTFILGSASGLALTRISQIPRIFWGQQVNESTSQRVNKWIGLTQVSRIPRNFFKKSLTGLTGLTGLKENTNFNENENLFICETPEIPETLETPGFWSKSEANILIFDPKAKYKRLRRG